MNQNLLAVLGAVLLVGCMVLLRDCGERMNERDQARWSACVTTCSGSALVDSTRCLCIQSAER
jgi:hypothetical protein